MSRYFGSTFFCSAATSSQSCRHQHEGQTCELNLIDTPGHVDFNYEVSRSLRAGGMVA